MSAGMAGIIAAHWVKELPSTQLLFELQCQGPDCSWGGKFLYTDHAAHVAEELTRARYGEPRTVTTAEELDALPVGSVVIDAFGAACVLINKSMYLGWRRCTPAVAGGEHRRGPYLPATVLYEPAPDPLAAALNDPEGHALVQAIHDRKAQG